MSLRIALIGETGQLAKAIIREGTELEHRITALNRDELDLSWEATDIENKLFDFLNGFDALILAAAYTHVDEAETDEHLAFAVNAIAPAAIAQACLRRSIPMVHISTDYVFDGKSQSPYKPGDETAPLGVYGRSKRAGELATLETNVRAIILRSSWVFDGTGRNFLTSMLRLSDSHSTVPVVNDQLGRPTYSGDLARASLRAAEYLVRGKELKSKIYHVTNVGPVISWARFAVEIFKVAKKDIVVKEIPSSEYPTPAKRPQYSVLDTSEFESDFDFELPNWQSGLKRALGA